MEPITIDNNHNYVYNTYKELNKIMPHNYLKVKVIPSKKYHFSTKEIINTIENNYNLNKYIDKNGKPKKCIYLYSSSHPDNLKKKIISKNILSQKTFNKTKNIDNKNRTNSNKNNNNFSRTKGFNSSPIKNYFLRNNICLPEITHRIKYKIPRNEREINGFKIIGNEIQTIGNNIKELKIINYNNNNSNKNNCKKTNTIKKVNNCCMTEENRKKKHYSLDKFQDDTLNIVSILSIFNKNKKTKLNFYDKTEEKNNSLY
jgi:hypothetical protein